MIYMNLDDEQTGVVMRWACFKAVDLFSGAGLHIDQYHSPEEIAGKLLERREESAKVLTLIDELRNGGIQTHKSGHYLAVHLAKERIASHQAAYGELAVERRLGKTYIKKKALEAQLEKAIVAHEIRAIAGDFWEAVSNIERAATVERVSVDA